MVPYKPDYRAGVVDLMKKVQGHVTTQERFAWEFERNPACEPNIFLALHDEQVVGMNAHNTFRMWIDGTERLVSVSMKSLTRPDYQGRGIFSELVQANEREAASRGCDLMLGFPNKVSTPIFLNRLGWSLEPIPHVLVRPTRPVQMLVQGLGRSPTYHTPSQADSPESTHVGALEIGPIDRFGQWANDLWADQLSQVSRGFIHDAAHLNWRFVDAPEQYRSFLIKSGPEIAGFFVVGQTTKRGVSIAFVACAALRDPFVNHYVALRASILRSFPASVWLDAGSSHLARSRVPRGGFLPSLGKLDLIYKGPGASEDWIRQAPWQIQLGDLDFF